MRRDSGGVTRRRLRLHANTPGWSAILDSIMSAEADRYCACHRVPRSVPRRRSAGVSTRAPATASHLAGYHASPSLQSKEAFEHPALAPELARRRRRPELDRKAPAGGALGRQFPGRGLRCRCRCPAGAHSAVLSAAARQARISSCTIGARFSACTTTRACPRRHEGSSGQPTTIS